MVARPRVAVGPTGSGLRATGAHIPCSAHSLCQGVLVIPFSVLDLSLITRGHGPADAFRNTLDLALLAESLGCARYWLAEHHGMPGIASAATAVLIGQVAAATRSIRAGAKWEAKA